MVLVGERAISGKWSWCRPAVMAKGFNFLRSWNIINLSSFDFLWLWLLDIFLYLMPLPAWFAWCNPRCPYHCFCGHVCPHTLPCGRFPGPYHKLYSCLNHNSSLQTVPRHSVNHFFWQHVATWAILVDIIIESFWQELDDLKYCKSHWKSPNVTVISHWVLSKFFCRREQLPVGAFSIYDQSDQSVPNPEPDGCNLQNSERDFCTFAQLLQG